MMSSFDVAVAAGFPSPALDYLEERLSLNDLYMSRPLSFHFFSGLFTS